MTAGNLRTALGQGVPFRLSIVALGGNREHRRDAYDTLGLGDVRDAEAERKVVNLVRDAPSTASPARTALPAAHFDRNKLPLISGRGH
jgi:hypothetical protein